MIKFVICFENEKLLNYLCEEITSCFSNRGVVVEVCTYTSATKLLHFPTIADIVLFNAELPGSVIVQGIEKLKQLNKNLISIAANTIPNLDYEQMFRLQPLYILNNPFSRSSLRATVCQAYEMCVSHMMDFSYYRRPEYKKVSIPDIIYFYSEARVIHMVTQDGEDSFYHKLDDIEKILVARDYHFIRIHKSFLVNPNYIAQYNRKTLTLTTGETLIISEYNRKQTNQYLRTFIDLSSESV